MLFECDYKRRRGGGGCLFDVIWFIGIVSAQSRSIHPVAGLDVPHYVVIEMIDCTMVTPTMIT